MKVEAVSHSDQGADFLALRKIRGKTGELNLPQEYLKKGTGKKKELTFIGLRSRMPRALFHRSVFVAWLLLFSCTLSNLRLH